MKESVVASMGVLFAGAQEIFITFSPLIAISFLTFCLLYTPCIAAIAAARRELGWMWAIFIVLFQCAIAWMAAFVVFQIGGLL